MLLIFRFFKSSFSKTKLCRKEIYPIYIFVYYFPILFSLRYFFSCEIISFRIIPSIRGNLIYLLKRREKKANDSLSINLTHQSHFRHTFLKIPLYSLHIFHHLNIRLVSLNEWMVDVDICKLKNWYIKNCKIKLGN